MIVLIPCVLRLSCSSDFHILVGGCPAMRLGSLHVCSNQRCPCHRERSKRTSHITLDTAHPSLLQQRFPHLFRVVRRSLHAPACRGDPQEEREGRGGWVSPGHQLLWLPRGKPVHGCALQPGTTQGGFVCMCSTNPFRHADSGFLVGNRYTDARSNEVQYKGAPCLQPYSCTVV